MEAIAGEVKGIILSTPTPLEIFLTVKVLVDPGSFDLNDITSKNLNSFFVSFNNSIAYSYIVTRTKSRKLFLWGQLFVDIIYQAHFEKLIQN